MQLLLISRDHRSFSLKLKPVMLLVILFLFACTLYYSFMLGFNYSSQQSSQDVEEVYAQIGQQYDEQYIVQKEQIQAVQSDAEKHLDAMAARLSHLQSHIMRLNALGTRLAEMAELEDFDFDADAVPGVGGPAPSSLQHSFTVPDFLKSLNELAQDVEDHNDKLTAMESVLTDSMLESQAMPKAAPVKTGWLSSRFGWRTDPLTGKKEFHSGIDFAGRSGTKIGATASGIVIWSARVNGYGNVVEIDHGNGYITRYAHNKKNLVEVGQRVERGDVIALMGSTGRSTGTHLHFEVLKNGKYINPKKFIALNQ